MGKSPAAKANHKTKKAAGEPIRTVWDDLCDTPGDAGKMLLRCHLVAKLKRHIKARKWPKAIAAKRCGVSLAQMELVRRGSVGRLTADELAGMIHTAGLWMDVHLEPLLRRRESAKERKITSSLRHCDT